MVKLMNGHQMALIRLMCSPSLQPQLSPGDLTSWQQVCICVCVYIAVSLFVCLCGKVKCKKEGFNILRVCVCVYVCMS